MECEYKTRHAVYLLKVTGRARINGHFREIEIKIIGAPRGHMHYCNQTRWVSPGALYPQGYWAKNRAGDYIESGKFAAVALGVFRSDLPNCETPWEAAQKAE